MEEEIDLNSRFPDMRPINGAPTMFSINGFGTFLYGKRDRDPATGTHVATLCLCLLFIPILALRSYRVAPAEGGGWYFLGSVPLSGFAKGSNVMLGCLVGALITMGAYNSWTNSPEYLAKQSLKQANELAAEGKHAKAYKEYVKISRSGTPHAKAAVEGMRSVIAEVAKSDDPATLIAVYRAAMPTQKKLGVNLYEAAAPKIPKIAEKAPRQALTLLDTVADAAPEAADLPSQREALLFTIAKLEPGAIDILDELAVILEPREEFDRVEALLTPHQDKLGHGEAARILGQLFLRKNKIEQAFPLLLAHVGDRLDTLHKAEEAYNKAIERASNDALKDLRKGKAPESWYRKYDAMKTEEEQQAAVDAYIQQRVSKNGRLDRALTNVREAAEVVPIALDLGILRLRRGQNMTDPEARRAELEAAEETFLAIGGIAGETDDYKMFYGQVCYWLGNATKGRQLFDELLAKHVDNFGVTGAVVECLREVGDEEDARAILTETFERTTDPKTKQAIAGQMAAMADSRTEKVKWLKLASPDDLSIQASLHDSRGHEALGNNQPDIAAEAFRKAIATYKKMTKSTANLNNEGLSWLNLFSVTGDAKDLAQANTLLSDAAKLAPDNAIVLYNTLSPATQAAMTEFLGDDYHPSMSTSLDETENLINFRCRDATSRRAATKSYCALDGIQYCRASAERLLVLAPKRTSIYQHLAKLYALEDNGDALDTLIAKFKHAAPDVTSTVGMTLTAMNGDFDDEYGNQIISYYTQAAEALAAAKAANDKSLIAFHGAALAKLEPSRRYADEPVDPELAVKRAEMAHAAAPSLATEWALVSALVHRAHHRAIASDPIYAQFAATHVNTCDHTNLMAAGMDRFLDTRRKLAADPDCQRAAKLLQHFLTSTPAPNTLPWAWAFVRHVNPDVAAKLAEQIRNDAIGNRQRALGMLINPADADAVFRVYWADIARGQSPAQARKHFDAWRTFERPLPL